MLFFVVIFCVSASFLSSTSVPECKLCSKNKRCGANGQTCCGAHSGLAHQSAIMSVSLHFVVLFPPACLAFIYSCFGKMVLVAVKVCRWISAAHSKRNFKPKKPKKKTSCLTSSVNSGINASLLPPPPLTPSHPNPNPQPYPLPSSPPKPSNLTLPPPPLREIASFYFFHLCTIIYSSPCAVSLHYGPVSPSAYCKWTVQIIVFHELCMSLRK